MPDIMAMTAGIGSIKQAIALTKEIRKASSATKSAELELQISDLAEAPSDAKLNLVGAQDVIVGPQRRIKELEETQGYRDKLILEDGVYVFKEPAEGRAPGPYCTRCCDVDNILVTITKLSAIAEMAGKYKCPNCSHIF